MTTVTITKTGIIELDSPIKVSGISLEMITVYLKFYNVAELTTYKPQDSETEINIPPGYYEMEDLITLTNNEIGFDENTLKVLIPGTLTVGSKRITNDNFLYLAPLCLRLYVEGINTTLNLFDGKRSDLLSIILIGTNKIDTTLVYEPKSCYKDMHNSEISYLKVKLEDEYSKEFIGRFNAVLELHS